MLGMPEEPLEPGLDWNLWLGAAGGNFWAGLAEVDHGFGVEGGDEYLVGHVVLAQQVAEGLHDGWVGLLDLDVHAHLREGLEQLFHGGYGDALATIGARPCRIVVGPVVGRIQRFQFGQGHLFDETAAVGGAVDAFVVHHHQHAVLGAVHVHLQHVHAQFDGVAEGYQGVVRPELFAALVGDDQYLIPVAKEGVIGHRPGAPG